MSTDKSLTYTSYLALEEIRLHGGRPCELLLNAVNLKTYPRYGSADQLAQFRLSSSYLR